MDDEVGTRPLSRQVSPPLSHSVLALRRRPIGVRGRLLVAALLFLLAGAAGALWWSLRGTPAVRYVTVQATSGPVMRTVTATGTVNPELTIIVGSYVSGVIQKLYCDYNTEVITGQICAKIDPRPYLTVVDQAKAILAVAKAQLEKGKANLAYTRLNYGRQQRLVELDSTSKDARDIAKNAYDQAQAQLGLDQATIQQREAELEAAEVNLGYTNIVSPVEGTVISRNVTQGQTVAASFQTPTLFLIATDVTKMQVDTNVSESDIGGVKEGEEATFTVDAFPKRIFEGTVTQVRQSPQTVQNVVTFDAVVSVDNRDLALKPGMTASTRIIIEQRDDVIRVPNQALRYVPGESANARSLDTATARATKPPTNAIASATSRLWLLRDGKPVPVDVALGIDDNNFTEILKGDLQPDDEVVVGEEQSTNSDRWRVPLPRL